MTQQNLHATTSTRGKTAQLDAIALLTEDHETVKELFQEYEQLGDKAHARKEKLARQICSALTVHTQIEEEIFYPAVRAAIEDDELMDEADVEHEAAKNLIAEIEGMSPDESHYDAKVKVLGEEIDHHVEEEEREMFPEVKKSKLDLKALGAEMAARKVELEQRSR